MQQANCRPTLIDRGRLKFDQIRQISLLLLPERVIELNESGAAILTLCTGENTIADICCRLQNEFDENVSDDVHSFLRKMHDLGIVRVEDLGGKG